MPYVYQIPIGIITCLLSFSMGYMLRHKIRSERRFPVGFFSMVAFLTLLLILSMFYQSIGSLQSAIGSGFATGFFIGITQKDGKKHL